MGLAGGLTFLLYGLDKLSFSLRTLAGGHLKHVLSRLTFNRVMAVLTGAGFAAMMQSSAATIALTISFLSSGMISLHRSLAVILGADVGTTITIQLIAFNVNRYALILVALGFFMQSICRRDSLEWLGRALMGLGMVFFGIWLVGQGAGIIKDWPQVTVLFSHLSVPLVGLLVGMVLTALMQSSAACIAIVIAFAGQGMLDLPTAILVTLGANIGTTFTGVLVSLRKNRDARRAALANVLFKVVGVALILPVVDQFLVLLMHVGESLGLTSFPRHVANFHTVFNILLACLFMPFLGSIEKLLYKIMARRKGEMPVQPKYLDAGLLTTPVFAMEASRLEMSRIAKRVAHMFREGFPKVLEGHTSDLETLKAMDDEVDKLYGHVITYLGNVSKSNLSENRSDELVRLMQAANHLEDIGDLVGNQLVRLGRKRIKNKIVISAQTHKMMLKIFNEVAEQLEQVIQAVRTQDENAADAIRTVKKDMNRRFDAAARHQLKRLTADEKNRLPTYSLEVELLDTLQRIYYHTRKVAKLVI